MPGVFYKAGMIRILKRLFEKLLQVCAVTILLCLAGIVVLAVVYRFTGASLIWYDELASVLLAWLTYYGAALAALKRGHLGFSGIFHSFPVKVRMVFFVFAEIFVIGFFAIIGWAGWYVLGVFGEEALISLPWLRLSVTQSVIPSGAVLFILAEVLSIPRAWHNARAGTDAEMQAIEEAIEEARQPS